MQNSFKEEDKEKFIEFLNSVAKNAKFNVDTQELCSYFKLLAYMQQVILKKMETNILEVKKVGTFEEPSKPTKGKKK